MTGPQTDGRRGFPRPDDYAAWRCSCGHICYSDETPGGPCRFCDCADHRTAGAA